jgi:uncharacterized protein (TIGR03382 family)
MLRRLAAGISVLPILALVLAAPLAFAVEGVVCGLAGEWVSALGGPQGKSASMTLIPVPSVSADGDDWRGTIRIGGDAFPLHAHREFKSGYLEGTWGDARRSGTFFFSQPLSCGTFQGVLRDGDRDMSWDGVSSATAAAPGDNLPSAQQIEDFIKTNSPTTAATPEAATPTAQTPPQAPPLGETPTPATPTPTESVHVTATPGPGIILVAAALVGAAWLLRRR